MPLHRDIYWVGRQWAVTGYGMQAVNQKRHGGFDIEASRIWDDAVLESLRAEAWFNPEDFNKGLSVARARYPEPPCKAAPVEAIISRQEEGDPVEPPKPVLETGQPEPAVQTFQMRIESWPAKFMDAWRVRVRR
jgi:hypothetical protein